MHMTIVDDIQAVFRTRGADAYFGEDVSTTEHSVQVAHLALQACAPSALVVAALLHDVGHLIDHVPGDIADWTHDAQHEQRGSLWLAKRFRPEVSEPVRLHVAAKRYLLARDPDYFAKLSPASVITLKLQGGPMTRDECAAFEKEDFHQDALRLRRWDDQGKVTGLRTPGVSHFAPLIEKLAL